MTWQVEERTPGGWIPIVDGDAPTCVVAFWSIVKARRLARRLGHRPRSLRLVKGNVVAARWHAGRYEPGDRSGRLAVVAVKRALFGDRLLVVDCECGRRGHAVRESSLRSGRAQSCGCYRDDVAASRKKPRDVAPVWREPVKASGHSRAGQMSRIRRAA